MEFEWEEEKAKANLEKHGVSFEQAARVFLDSLRFEYDDPYEWEIRSRVFGFVDGELYCVIVTDRGDKIRIISARKASQDEKRKHRLF